MKRPQTKFNAHTMSHFKVIRSRSQILLLGQNILAAEFFLVINILLKLQQILT